MSRHTTKLAAAAAVAAGLAGGATLAGAAIPSSTDGQISACYSAANPALRVVDAERGQTCAAGETPISWNRGMRFKGEYSGVPDYKAGDVVRISKKYNTGCTTPKGTWLALVDGASPCTERPESWATLALDGSSADTHWMRLDAAGKVISSSDPVVEAYPYTGYGLYRFGSVPNHVACAATATVASFATQAVVPFTQSYGQYLLVGGRNVNGGFTPVALDVTLSCQKYN